MRLVQRPSSKSAPHANTQLARELEMCVRCSLAPAASQVSLTAQARRQRTMMLVWKMAPGRLAELLIQSQTTCTHGQVY